MDATITVPIAVITGGSHGPTTDTEAPPLIDTSVPHTAAALNASDVVLYILDARDPLSYRSAFIENTVGEKPMLYILNKIGEF
jgi:nuclear GTP-binding protein